jgi:RimJ/RimL family protein N-acetyltransferase
MNNIQFVLIETDSDFEMYGAPLKAFFDSLDTEKKFFTYLNMDYARKSDFVLAAMDGDRIVGVAGVETTHLFAHKAYVGVKKEYQSGLGAFLSLKRNHEARNRYSFIILKINPRNTASQQMNQALGYKEIGRRFSDDYLMMPFNFRGTCTFYALKAILPAVNCIDHLLAVLKLKPKI